MEMGLEAGAGGQIVAEGTVQEIRENEQSVTGRYLRKEHVDGIRARN